MLEEAVQQGGHLACSHTNCKINNECWRVIFRYLRENFNPVKSLIVLRSSVIRGDRCHKSASWLTAKGHNQRRNRTGLKRTTEGKGKVVVSGDWREIPLETGAFQAALIIEKAQRILESTFKTLLPENYEWDGTLTIGLDIPQYGYAISSIVHLYKEEGKWNIQTDHYL